MDDTGVAKVCPKCNAVMDRGSLFDSGNWIGRQTWNEKAGLHFTGGRVTITFACTQCGYLESYLEIK